jgi:YD repeat-containing protein
LTATTYTYDALNRLTSHAQNGTTVTHAYNGDGVLVSDVVSSGTPTRYTQDLAAALPQVLQTLGDRPQTHLYGQDRLATDSVGTRTWEVHDALGSVRQVFNNQGGKFTAQQYDAWGVLPNFGMPSRYIM